MCLFIWLSFKNILCQLYDCEHTRLEAVCWMKQFLTINNWWMYVFFFLNYVLFTWCAFTGAIKKTLTRHTKLYLENVKFDISAQPIIVQFSTNHEIIVELRTESLISFWNQRFIVALRFRAIVQHTHPVHPGDPLDVQSCLRCLFQNEPYLKHVDNITFASASADPAPIRFRDVFRGTKFIARTT